MFQVDLDKNYLILKSLFVLYLNYQSQASGTLDNKQFNEAETRDWHRYSMLALRFFSDGKRGKWKREGETGKEVFFCYSL